MSGRPHVVLGIETSCDETSAGLLVGEDLRSHVILSQDVHKVYAGVVPELAARAHLRVLDDVVRSALGEAGLALHDVDLFGVTAGPGLIGALLVGVAWTKSAAWALDRPLVGVHHMEAHLFAASLEDPEAEPPFVALLVSGGHTLLLWVPEWGRYELLGETRPDDDAYYAFSFSGLKTAVLTRVRSLEEEGRLGSERDAVARSFQRAVLDVLVAKTLRAAEEKGCRRVLIGGGVAASRALREALRDALGPDGRLFHPTPRMATDNGAMIARTARFRHERGDTAGTDLTARADLPFPGLMR
jgi:N6-L-threonylcarbamoyladenine synthase